MPYDVGYEKISVRTATLNSIDGVNIYNERGYMQEEEPSWYVNLKRKCENEPEHIHILLLEDLDEASKEVENAILDNIFKGKCYLPSNARVVATSRKPLSQEENSPIILDNLIQMFIHLFKINVIGIKSHTRMYHIIV